MRVRPENDMRMHLLTLSALLGLVSAAGAGPAAKAPRPGRTTRMECLVAADQSYSLYLPKRYEEGRAWPILYCFDPNGNGTEMVKHFQPVAEELGWIVAGSLTARNGPSEPNERAWKELLRDTESRLRLDGKQRVSCGFSGMSWVASRMAYGSSERFAGVILLGQGLDPTIKVDPDLAVAMIMGDQESRLHELADVRAMCERGPPPIPGFFETFPGGHRPAPDEWLARALRWHGDTWRTRYDGCDDAATRRRDRATRRRYREAVALEEQGRKAHALVELRQVRDGFRNVPLELTREVEKLITDLETTTEVKAEARARKKLLKLVARDRKLRPRQRTALAKKYEKLAAEYPGTPSADVALDRVALVRRP